MKFFIPSMGPENAEVVYLGIRTFLANEWGFPLTARRVHKLSYTSKGQRQDVTVGRQIGTDHETVFAIFETLQDQPTQILCTGRYLDKLAWSPAGLRFREKTCVYDSTLIPGSIVFPL